MMLSNLIVAAILIGIGLYFLLTPNRDKERPSHYFHSDYSYCIHYTHPNHWECNYGNIDRLITPKEFK